MANVIVEISWEAGVTVKLVSLRDNAEEKLGTWIRDSDGMITLEFEASAAIAHRLDWDLWSGDATMKRLRVVAHWEHGQPKELARADEARGRWHAGGDL